MREIVLDTETTGLDHENGDRIVEIGIVELKNYVQTGEYFHYHLNPERDSDPKALKIHGLTKEFLSNKPKFNEIVEDFLDFISDSKIVIHNAAFDIGFINAELGKCKLDSINSDKVIDTLFLAKKKYAGQSLSLDALCRKFSVDISNREIHGALKDAKLLAQVYLELIGGKQTNLKFNNEVENKIDNQKTNLTDLSQIYKNKEILQIKRVQLNKLDYEEHLDFIKKIPNSIWSKL